MKGIFMKIKDEKGFTGIDITVAVIIIMLFMTLIGTIFYNITASHRQLERKTEATYIAIIIITIIIQFMYLLFAYFFKLIVSINKNAI